MFLKPYRFFHLKEQSTGTIECMITLQSFQISLLSLHTFPEESYLETLRTEMTDTLLTVIDHPLKIPMTSLINL